MMDGTTTFSQALVETLKSAGSVVVLTGAGMSAESGVPTFRGEDGLWRKFKPEELANVDAFMRNPDLVWEWYRERKRVISSIEPNAGHHALVRLEGRYPEFCIVTQNIDNLHRRAGSKRIHELHGNIERSYCIRCGRDAGDLNLEQGPGQGAPRCAACKGLIRPDVVWFGEMLPEDQWAAAAAASERADLFLSVGTSSVVYPAASLPLMAKQSGAYLVEINIERTDLSVTADEVLLGKSGEILPRMAEIVCPQITGS